MDSNEKIETIQCDKDTFRVLIREIFEIKDKHLRCGVCGRRVQNDMSNIGGLMPSLPNSKYGNVTLLCNSILCMFEYQDICDESPKTI